MPAMSQPICIIVPIHNAYTYVSKCIESILSGTQGMDYHLLLVDDASTDPRIAPYLLSLEEAYPEGVTVKRMEKNVGFVQAVNAGFALVDQQDVVILNSDTQVFNGWLQQLSSTASTQMNVGSVTPLSNEASIYSVARKEAWLLRKQNRLAQFAKRIAAKQHPNALRIPTAVGFCMYIPWKALEAVGPFDTIFGHGYGEENDWCMRATAKGFVHYLDDAVFVYHAGGVSMAPAGIIPSRHVRSIPEHEELLQKRHPTYRKRVRRFLRHPKALNVIKDHAKNLAQDVLSFGMKRIAHCMHTSIHKGNIGGVEYHVADLVTSMNDCDHYVLSPTKKGLSAERYLHNTLIDTTEIPIKNMQQTHTSLRHLSHFIDFLREQRIEVLHIHHAMGSTYSLITAAKTCNIPVVFTIHDYHALGGQPQLCTGDSVFERIPDDTEICNTFTAMTHGQWRNTVRPLIAEIDAVISPSSAALQLFEEVYPLHPKKKHIIEHGVPKFGNTIPVEHHHKERVCFVGYVHASHKGKADIANTIPLLLEQGKEVYMLGTEAQYWPDIAEMEHVHFLGTYKREELAMLLNAISPGIVCLFSRWPETFNYILSECWRMHIPVCVSNQGALADRVRDSDAGVVLESREPKDIAQTLQHALGEKPHAALYEKTKNTKISSMKDMTDAYQGIYDSCLSAKAPQESTSGPLPNFVIIGAQKSGSTWLWNMLAQHPDIYMAGESETHFFSKNAERIAADMVQYRQQFFSKHTREHAIGEKTAGYFWVSNAYPEWKDQPARHPRPIAKNIQKNLGNTTKILLTLRHPVERALSAYCHFLHEGKIEPERDFFTIGKERGIIHMGFYAAHLQEWLRWFALEQLKILLLEEDIAKNPSDTLRDVQSFLGVEHPEMIPKQIGVVGAGNGWYREKDMIYAHTKKQETPVAIATVQQLQELYRIYYPDMQQLEEIIGRNVTKFWTQDAPFS